MSAKVPAPKRVSSKIRKYCAMPFLTVIPMPYFTRISVLGCEFAEAAIFLG